MSTKRDAFYWIKWVALNSPFQGTTRVVHLLLGMHASKDEGTCFPSVALLTKEANVSRRSVQYALAKIEDAGYLERGAKGYNRPSDYRLLQPDQGVQPTAPPMFGGVKPIAPQGVQPVAQGVQPASRRGATFTAEHGDNAIERHVTPAAAGFSLDEYLEYAEADETIKNPTAWASKAHQEQWDLEAKWQALEQGRPSVIEQLVDGTDTQAIDRKYA